MNGFFTKLVGVTFTNEDGSNRQDILREIFDNFDPDVKIFLKAKRETDNPYDPKAVAIFTEDDRQLGYLSRKVNETVAPWLDEGWGLLVEIVSVNGDEGYVGINIWIERTRKIA